MFTIDDGKRIGNILRRARKENYLTKKFVASKVGLSHHSYCCLEQCSSNLTISQLINICSILNIDPTSVVRLENSSANTSIEEDFLTNCSTIIGRRESAIDKIEHVVERMKLLEKKIIQTFDNA